MGMFSNLGGGAKVPGGNQQWSQLANFFPDAQTAGKSGHSIDIASILASLGQQQQPQVPPATPPPQWLPPPPPQFLGALQNAPRLSQGQMMPPPAYMQPYLWGGR